MKNFAIGFCFMLLVSLAFTGCSDDKAKTIIEPEEKPAEEIIVRPRVAVVLPMDEANQKIWNGVTDWILENLKYAQKKVPLGKTVLPEIEYYDENTVDIAALGKKLAADDSIRIIIGPLENHNVELLAQQVSRVKKAVIAPRCTTFETCRKLAGKGFFWSLCESDVTQLSMMLSEATIHYNHTMDTQTVSLISSESLSGSTYLSWFDYEAQEMHLNVGQVYSYSEHATIEKIKKLMCEACSHNTGVLLCAPDDEEEATAMIEAVNELDAVDVPTLIFNERLYSPKLLNWRPNQETITDVLGFAPVADPASGFAIRFRNRMLVLEGLTDRYSMNASQYYDALLIASLAMIEVELGYSEDYTTAIQCIVSDKDGDVKREHLNGWDADNLCQIIWAMQKGIHFDLDGASGAIHFDPKLQSSSTQTVYALYQYADQSDEDDEEDHDTFQIVDYLTKDGTSRTTSNEVKWQEVSEQFSTVEGSDIEYANAATDSWALLVSGSTQWKNYRHTADVLDMYRMLRQNGYPADHIIVVADKQLLTDSNNPNPGTLVRYDKVQLYPDQDASIDYQIYDRYNAATEADGIELSDIFRILNGDATPAHLKKVMHTDSLSNVLVYWSGHGNRLGYFEWGDSKTGVNLSRAELADFLTEYERNQKYRKMLWVVEPCYGASVTLAVDDAQTKHVLFMSSANGGEESKVDGNSWLNDYDCWMADLFTENLVNTFEQTPNISYGNLYEEMVRKTIGSHPTLTGADRFDQLYFSSPREFFVYDYH